MTKILKEKIDSATRPVDEMALLAAKDDEILETLIKKERAYILACAGKTLSRHVEKGGEEEGVAMEAFVEAVKSYSYEKGGFLSFAKLVISRRIIDWVRREKRRENIILMDPADVVISKDLNDFEHSMLNQEPEILVAEEIGSLSKVLKEYGFTFMDIASASPKALKTREACKQAIQYILGSDILLEEVRSRKMLPVKTLEKKLGIPRKVLERHRKYIVTVIEITKGDYPYLNPYVKSMVKEM